MSLSAAAIARQLSELENTLGPAAGTKPARFLLAYSGGLDSSVLLDLLARSGDHIRSRLLAVHIDHQLHSDSAIWAEHCRSVAADAGVDFTTVTLFVDQTSGKGPEAAAREARYEALAGFMADGDFMLTAQHQDDQAETLLLNLLRGSGPEGLAAMPGARPFHGGWLIRPLLGHSREELEEYARDHGVAWSEDPSNASNAFDRNFLRNEVLPLLQSRWPHAAKRFARSAELAGEAAVLTGELAEQDLLRLGGNAARLPIDELLGLSEARRNNLIRHALRQLELPPPAGRSLNAIEAELLCARDDAEPRLCWPGAEARRYRNTLYLMAPFRAANFVDGSELGSTGIELGPGFGSLSVQSRAARGLATPLAERGLRLQHRVGGEEIKPVGQTHTRKLKKLLQEAAVLPWMRDQLPLIYAGEDLVAVADLWLAADAVAENGLEICWESRPELY